MNPPKIIADGPCLPNNFSLYTPIRTNLAGQIHTNVIKVQADAKYIMDCLQQLDKTNQSCQWPANR